MRNELLCFSHLDWHSVFQRPNHLMSRAARDRRVYWVEDPRYFGGPDRLEVKEVQRDLYVVSPRLSMDTKAAGTKADVISRLLEELLHAQDVVAPDHVYESPMLWPYGRNLSRTCVVYDCMDELALFRGADRELILETEADLMRHADVVVCGGRKLYEAKRSLHTNVHCIQSGVDVGHFWTARQEGIAEPSDQLLIQGTRIGWAGVLDERHDWDLLRYCAEQRPHYSFVMVGPFTKVDVSTVPRLPNIHYLGMRPYADLPRYMAYWSVAIMSFALNDSTMYISPTKTPEYLAAGLPVVSTAIDDVVDPYEVEMLVRVGRSKEEFLKHIDNLRLCGQSHPDLNPKNRDKFLLTRTWDAVWEKFDALLR